MSELWVGFIGVAMILFGGLFAYISTRLIRKESTTKYENDFEYDREARGNRKVLGFSVIFLLLGCFITGSAYQDSSFYYLFHPHQQEVLTVSENLKGAVENAQIALAEGEQLETGEVHVPGQAGGSHIVLKTDATGSFTVTAWMSNLGSSANSVSYDSSTGQFILHGTYESFGHTPYGSGYALASQQG